MTLNLRTDVISGCVGIFLGIALLGANWGLWWQPPESGIALFWRIGVAVAIMVIAAIATAIVSGIANRDLTIRDERETMVVMRSMRNLCFVYAGGLAIILMEAFSSLAPMTLAHGVIGIFVVGEVVRLGSIGYYLTGRD